MNDSDAADDSLLESVLSVRRAVRAEPKTARQELLDVLQTTSRLPPLSHMAIMWKRIRKAAERRLGQLGEP